MKRNLLFVLVALLSLVASADEYTDPQTNVIYTYNPASNRAEVKSGTWLMFDNGEASLPTPGSPDAKDEIGILDRFSVEGKEYVVDKIGDYAFSTLDIKSVVIPSSVKSIGMDAFLGCVSLSDLFLSEGLISIEDNAFCGCHSLTYLLLPEGLETIGFESFTLCSKLKSVSIPSSVTNIDVYAFLYCSSLTDVYCYAENVPITESNVFYECPIASATLHVPAGSLEKYKTTSPWNEFGSIVALPETNTFIQDIAWVDGFGYEQDGQYKLDNVELFYYSVAGDTLINSKNYFRIQRNRICKTHCELEVDEYSCETEEDTLCFFMREDAAGDVWFYTEDKNVFEKISHNTLYNDYNLADDLICRDLFLFNFKKKYAIGETLPLGVIALDSPNGFREGEDYWDIYPYEVKSIDEMSLLDGKTYKLYNDYILEGIGPLSGPLIGIGTPNSYALDFNQLFAFFRNGQLIYRNEGYVSALEEYFPNILDIVTGKHQNDPDDNTADSLYGEWWLVGWNDGGDWFEVDTNYVSHQSLSIELKDKKEGPSMAYSMANVIIVGLLTLNGNEMTFEEGGWYTSLYCGFEENDFFEDHICKIKSYQLEGSQLRLYYTDEDYFVFTNDFDDSEEHFYEWKYGPADPYIAEVIAKSDTEVDVKIIDNPTSAIGYSRTRPPRDSSDICHFAPSDLADQSFEVGDKVAFRIVQFKRLKVEEGKEYELKVEPISGSGHITNRTGIIHNDQRMGWIIADGEQGDTYYYPLKKLAEKYLVEGLPVKVSGELYSTWRTPWESQGHPTGYYLSIDFLTSPQYNDEDVTFTKDLMATIILPTAPDAGKGKYYRLDKCEDGKIIFEQEKQPQARTPYIIVPSEDFSIDPSTLDLAGLSPDTVSIAGISFIGTYTSKVLPSLGGDGGGSYYDIIDTTPDCQAEEGKAYTIGALHAYLTVNWDDPINHDGSKGPGEKMEIVLKDNETGISSLSPDPSPVREGSIYDLSGRRLSGKLERGIYIEDGKKKVK